MEKHNIITRRGSSASEWWESSPRDTSHFKLVTALRIWQHTLVICATLHNTCCTMHCTLMLHTMLAAIYIWQHTLVISITLLSTSCTPYNANCTDALHTDVAQSTQCFTVIVIVMADVVVVVVYFLRHWLTSSSFQRCVICGVWLCSGMIWRVFIENVEVMTDKWTDLQNFHL